MSTVILNILDIMEWLDHNFVFTIKNLLSDLGIKNTKLNREFCEMVLYYNKIAFKMDDFGIKHHGYDFWRSRSSFFNDRLFSITLTDLEHKKEILIPGSRFTPYTNHFFRYRHMTLEYKGKHIKQKLLPITFKEVKEYYYLCPEHELLSMLESISIDNGTIQEDFVDDDDIFYVPAYNIKAFYSDMCLTEEDQIVLKVKDWGHVELELVNKTPRTIGKIYKKKWNIRFEQLLKHAIACRPSENYLIEDVIAYMATLDPGLFFHKKYFVSLENYLKNLNLIETIDFGVKDKIWLKDAPIILDSEWFSYVYGIPNILQVSNEYDDFLCTIGSPLTINIIRLAIYSFLDENYVKLNDDPDEVQTECLQSIIQDFFSEEKYKEHNKKILSIVKKEYKKHVKKFNPFKNRDMIELSLSIFQLFRRMISITSYAKEKNLLPDKMDFTVIVMLNQFAEDVSPLLRMTEEFLDSKKVKTTLEQRQKKKEVSLIRDKFNSFLNNVEDYVFSTF